MAEGNIKHDVKDLSKRIDRLMRRMNAEDEMRNRVFLHQDEVAGMDRASKMQLFQLFVCFGSEDSNYSPKQLIKSHLSEFPTDSTKDNIKSLVAEGKGRELVSMMEKAIHDDLICEKTALIFALALCSRSSDTETKQAAYKLCPLVCVTSHDLLTFNQYALLTNYHIRGGAAAGDALDNHVANSEHPDADDGEMTTKKDHEKRDGESEKSANAKRSASSRKVKASCWGRAHRKALSNWYKRRDPRQLAYEVMKQTACGGWSHHDIIRQCHIAITPDETDYLGNAVVLRYIMKGLDATRSEYSKHQVSSVKETLEYLEQLHAVRYWTSENQVIKMIADHGLPRDLVPTKLLKSKQVWAALLRTSSLPDILENITSFASFGHLSPDSDNYQIAVNKINGSDPRVGPYKVYSAWKRYQKGQKGNYTYVWETDPEVMSKLNSAFQSSLKNLGRREQKVLLAIHTAQEINRYTVAECLTRSPISDVAALAEVVAECHGRCDVVVFSTQVRHVPVATSTNFADLLSAIAEKVTEVSSQPKIPRASPMCSAPLRWAIETKKEVDTFIVYTDSKEMGDMPLASLQAYREQINNNARLVYCNPKVTRVLVNSPARGVFYICPFDYNSLHAVTSYIQLPDV